jgi:molybdopterin synthase sulfur carrier subunit
MIDSDRAFLLLDRAAIFWEPTMPITVDIPPPLREQAGGNLKVTVTGGTVHECLDDLVRQHPALGPKLFDNGRLRPHVNVLVNDEDIRYLDDLGTDVADGVIVALIPAVAGG